MKNNNTNIEMSRAVFNQLWGAVCNNDIKKIARLMEEGADLDGITPLHMAAQEGKLDIIRYLTCEKELGPDQSDNDDVTPLLLAACYGHTEVVQELIERGADVNRADNEGETPLSLAIHYGCVDVVRILLANDAFIPENISFNENVNQELQNEINRMLNSKRAELASQLVIAKGSRFFPDMSARRPREENNEMVNPAKSRRCM